LRAMSAGSLALASATACWNSMAADSASTALANSTRAPSPVSLTRRPLYFVRTGSRCSERFLRRRASVPLSSRPIRRE
jgi:hypothetical protein